MARVLKRCMSVFLQKTDMNLFSAYGNSVSQVVEFLLCGVKIRFLLRVNCCILWKKHNARSSKCAKIWLSKTIIQFSDITLSKIMPNFCRLGIICIHKYNDGLQIRVLYVYLLSATNFSNSLYEPSPCPRSSKQNCHAETSPKKRTNKFVFLSWKVVTY